MPDWKSPHALQVQAAALQRMTLLFVGIYLHDFVHSLAFDWRLVTRKDARRSFLARSVKWIYIACRYTTLAACISLAVLNLSREALHCQVFMAILNDYQLAGFLTAASGTLLLFVRVGVIWEWKRWVTVTFTLAYLTSVALALRSVVLVRATYEPTPVGPFCNTTSTFRLNRWNISMTLVIDVGLVTSLFLGLRRWADARHSTSSVWFVLLNQNMIYLALAIALEAPMAVFFFLSYDELMELMFTVPEIMILPIAATRFYRSLTSFTGSRNDYTYESIVTQSPKPQAMEAVVPKDLDPDGWGGTSTTGIRLRSLSISRSSVS